MYIVKPTGEGTLMIGHPLHPGLAWSDRLQGWTTLFPLGSCSHFPPDTFDTEEALEAYVNENHLYPRVD